MKTSTASALLLLLRLHGNLLLTATVGGLPTSFRNADALRDAPSGRTVVSLNPSLRGSLSGRCVKESRA